MRWLLCAAISLFVSTARAEEQYWVAVGSYRNLGYAQEALDRANAALDESFVLSSLDIEAERWYRVMAGPYLTRGVAELTLVDAQLAGFETSWMLVTEASDLEADLADGYGSYDEYAPLDDGFEERYDEYRDDYSFRENQEPAKTPREVVDQAPEGYGLHKLRREGR